MGFGTWQNQIKIANCLRRGLKVDWCLFDGQLELGNLQAPIGVLPHCPTCPIDWKATNQIEDTEGNNVVVLIMFNKNMSFHSFVFCICFENIFKIFSMLVSS
jgi:hypothetical protein